MLRGFRSAYMSSVFRGPENEGGADVGDAGVDLGDVGGGADVDGGDNPDGDDAPAESAEGSEDQGSKKPLSVREQLKKTIAEAQAGDGTQVKPAKQAKPKQEAKPATQQQGQQQPTAVAPPNSLAKELHAEWAKAPKAIQDAFIKREQDMQRGVDELKQRYSKIDEALAPHSDALRQMNATPGEAVDRMFQWFKALSNSPGNAFPALASSFGFDWAKVVQAAQGAQQQGQQGQQAEEIPPSVKNYIGQLEQRLAQLDGRFNGIATDIQQSNMQKTQENLAIWSKDKEFFEDVRKDMATMIQGGLIPLKENGQVDLDTAYERAIYFNPDVRAKVLAKQQQADTQAQQQATQAATTARQQQATKARKAASSIPTSNAPGNPAASQGQKKPGQRMSVRDSLQAAVAQLRDQ